MRVQALGRDGFGTYEVGPDWRRIDGEASDLLVPGFVDIHIHGAYGIDFMSSETDELVTLAAKLQQAGYDAFLPTTVTASAEEVRSAIDRLPDHPMIPGFHLEGPFISPDYPGAQPPQFILDADTLESWSDILDHPKLKVVTLAPERAGAREIVSRLSARGVRVSVGHSNATYEECNAAFQAGARHTTHTYNAMRPLHHREAGVVGFALEQDEVYAELIYDRKHVAPEAAAVLIKCKPADKLIAVSDSTLATGLPAGTELSMWGHECVVGEGEVRLRSGALAGSAITLLNAFQNLLADFGPETAIRATSLNPRQALGWGEPRTYNRFSQSGDLLESGITLQNDPNEPIRLR